MTLFQVYLIFSVMSFYIMYFQYRISESSRCCRSVPIINSPILSLSFSLLSHSLIILSLSHHPTQDNSLERRTVATGRWSAGCSVTGARSAGVTSGALADLVELGNLDGLPDALEIDAYDTGLVAGYAVLRRWSTVAGANSASATESAAESAAAAAARLGLFLQKDLSDLLEQGTVHGSTLAGLTTGGHLGVTTTTAAAEGEAAATAAAEGVATTATTAARSAVTVAGRRLSQGEPSQTDNHAL